MPGNDISEKLLDLLERLLDAFGPQNWWPGDTPWEVCVGAVLTQNTNWSNVEKAIANLKSAGLLPDASSPGLATEKAAELADFPSAELAELIRPSGYFNIKAERLKAVARWWSAEAENARSLPLPDARESILGVKGVGKETADSVLLYAFDMPTFVIDAYTKRIMARYLGTPSDMPYDDLRALFMDNLSADVRLYNEFHALLVRLAKDFCLKRGCYNPDGCPLETACGRIGLGS